jgi:uncharacterized protein (TIGR00661 family)
VPKGKILVAVLNWGLGHATRCIPLIRGLMRFDFQPIIGSDGKALDFLKEEFPNLKYYELTSLQFSYSKNSALNQLHLLSRSIFWNNQLQKDKLLIENIHQQENLAGIISDSRPYCYYENISCIYLTHQLQVKSGIFSRIATATHRRLINRFNECWVPDFEKPNAFCGEMSQWENAPLPIRYIGILSDLQTQQTNQKYDYAGIISGAEPERSKLEQQLINSFSRLKGKKIIIAGSKETNDRWISTDFEIKGLANRAEVQHIINSSKTLVARGGYSTMMDLLQLRKSALLIPTPGQTEQLYLTQHLKQLGYFDLVSQDKLSAERIVQFKADGFRLGHVAFSGFDFCEVFSLFECK